MKQGESPPFFGKEAETWTTGEILIFFGKESERLNFWKCNGRGKANYIYVMDYMAIYRKEGGVDFRFPKIKTFNYQKIIIDKSWSGDGCEWYLENTPYHGNLENIRA